MSVATLDLLDLLLTNKEKLVRKVNINGSVVYSGVQNPEGSEEGK